jgi:hypothetical protein
MQDVFQSVVIGEGFSQSGRKAFKRYRHRLMHGGRRFIVHADDQKKPGFPFNQDRHTRLALAGNNGVNFPMASPGNKGITCGGVYWHDRGAAQEAAEVHPFTGLFTRYGNDPYRGGFMVHHADGHFIGNDGGDCGGGGIPREGDHIKAHGTDAGHGFQFIQAERTRTDCGYHALIFGYGDKGTGKTAHMGGGHDSALFDHIREDGQSRRWCRGYR